MGSEKKWLGLRKADVVLMIGITLFAAALFLFSLIRDSGNAGAFLEVSVNGQVTGRYSLSEDRVVELGGNTFEIRDGEVRMTEADCPDKSCVHTAPISSHGGVIVCLPNRVVLRIVNGEEDIDAIAQ